MDWNRAKSIILLLLLAFNIFLLANIIVYATNQGIPGETIENTQKILQIRGIELECSVPRYDRDIPRLIYKSGKYDKTLLAKKLLGDSFQAQGQVDGSDTYESGRRKLVFKSDDSLIYTDESPGDRVDVVHINAIEKYIRKYLNSTGIIDSSYILDDQSLKNDGSVEVTFIKKYKSFLVFDNYLKTVITDKGITSLESGYRQIISLSPEKVRDISTAYQILLGNFTGSEKLTVTGVDIGYKDSGSREKDMIQSFEQLPVWRVKIKGTDIPKYFNASDGKELK